MKRNCIIAFFHFCLETCPVKSPFSNPCGRAQSLQGKSRYYGSWASLKLELKILFLFLWSASSWSLVLEVKRVVVAHPLFSFSYFFSFSGLGRMVGKIKRTKLFSISGCCDLPVAINAPLGGNKLGICFLFWRNISDFCRRRQWLPTPVLLPGKSHGWRSLVGCSPWGR